MCDTDWSVTWYDMISSSSECGGSNSSYAEFIIIKNDTNSSKCVWGKDC